MSIFRVEVDTISGELVRVDQQAYTDGTDLVVIDDGDSPPEGFYPVNQEPEQ